ncbi:MAG: phosphatidate cytidylyltransferase [Bacteroidetes bacterium]|nr:phosphatidate cytidylyltransferase [Bacteroidota bacterium]
MNNLTQRTITGVILVLVITVLTSWSAYSFVFLTLAIDILSLVEFYRLFQASLSPNKWGGIILSTGLVVTSALAASRITGPNILLINIPVTFGIFICELYRKEPHPFHNLAFTFLGILFVTVPVCFFIAIAYFPLQSGIYRAQIPLGYFFILWASDTGAYFTGKAFGVRPLFKRISPKKTWEGSLGGTACALFVAYVVSRYLAVQDAGGWMGTAMIIVVAGTFGDLIKSLLKRSLNLKDSGTILPGHGGMLDRFDTLFGSAPLVFCYFVLFLRA